MNSLTTVRAPVPADDEPVDFRNHLSRHRSYRKLARQLTDLRHLCTDAALSEDFSDAALTHCEHYIALWERLVSEIKARKNNDEEEGGDDDDVEEEGSSSGDEVAAFTWKSMVAVVGKTPQRYTYGSVLFEWAMAANLLGFLMFKRARYLHQRLRKGEYSASPEQVEEVTKTITQWYIRAIMVFEYARTHIIEQWTRPVAVGRRGSDQIPECRDAFYEGMKRFIRVYIFSLTVDKMKLSSDTANVKVMAYAYQCAYAMLQSSDVVALSPTVIRVMVVRTYMKWCLQLHAYYAFTKNRVMQVSVLQAALKQRDVDEVPVEDPLRKSVAELLERDRTIYHDVRVLSDTDEAYLDQLPRRHLSPRTSPLLQTPPETWTKFTPSLPSSK